MIVIERVRGVVSGSSTSVRRRRSAQIWGISTAVPNVRALASCTRDGVTYYESCGATSGTCYKCKSEMIGKSYWCCDDTCGRLGECEELGLFSSCSSYHSSCKNGGGSPSFQDCWKGDEVDEFATEWLCQ